ncbi:MAG TPA: 2-amino-4-hydroxy-6-hydroxymethyldihydropteridine diphosphokinase [Stellaceae bacterium]|nr:2-amino-4-hydroxy-6-hydroxymethyldihydropteridine diphosphokinase [Stellaceae bacterium]
MILIGIGSNLAAPPAKTPLATAQCALPALAAAHLQPVACSSWYESAPVPESDQPWFVNAVALISTDREPEVLLRLMLDVETRFGRVRGERNAARTLDLDLLDYDGLIIAAPHLTLPHPRLHERRFVLEPLCEIAPRWRHPWLGLTAMELASRLPSGQQVRRIDG